jgi:alkylation response protein AidB-like acyl-CoA dehydrogenase
MDFSWTPEQLAFKNTVVEFAKKELNAGLIDRDHAGEISLENWRKCADLGILGLPIPEEYGGIDEEPRAVRRRMTGRGTHPARSTSAFPIPRRRAGPPGHSRNS